MTTKTTTNAEWLRAAVERSKGRSAPVFEEARRRGISQREFHAALASAGLTLTDFGERIRRAPPAAKPSGAPAGKAPPTRPAKPSAAQLQARAAESFAAWCAVLRERRRAEEAAAAAVKPPPVRIDYQAIYGARHTPPGNVFGGRRHERR